MEPQDPLVVGGSEEEAQTRVTSPGATHVVRVFGALSPDVLLAHQARTYLFQLYVDYQGPLVEIQKASVRRMIPRY